MRARTVMALTGLGLVLCVVGCGKNIAPGAPFAGTWRPSDPAFGSNIRLVIGKSGDSYRVALVGGQTTQGWLFYLRHGNKLSGEFPVLLDGKPTGRAIKEVITFRPATGRLVYADDGGPSVEFYKIGTGTSIPSPSPGTR